MILQHRADLRFLRFFKNKGCQRHFVFMKGVPDS